MRIVDNSNLKSGQCLCPVEHANLDSAVDRTGDIDRSSLKSAKCISAIVRNAGSLEYTSTRINLVVYAGHLETVRLSHNQIRYASKVQKCHIMMPSGKNVQPYSEDIPPFARRLKTRGERYRKGC